MANIQEDVTRQVWELFLKFFGTGTEFVYQIAHEGNVMLKQGGNFTSEFLIALINKQKENKEPTDITALMLKRVEKGESINTMSVAEEDAEELNKCFQEKGVLYKVIDNLNDDTKFFMYMSDDSQKVIDIITLWQAEKGLISELNPELFLDNYAQAGVGTVSGLDKTDLEAFRSFAKANGLIYASTPAEDSDKNIIIYDPKDSKKLIKTMSSVLWAFSGENGKLLQNQMNTYLLNKQQINRTLLEPEKEFYIVSSTNPKNYVHLTANDLTYYKNSKEISNVVRSSPDFIEKGIRIFDGLSCPVLLTREEFEQFTEQGEHKKEVVEKIVSEKAKTLPNYKDILEAQEKHNNKLELIQSKMALDEENTAGFWIYDEGISFADSGRYEDLEDIDEQTKTDLEDAYKRAKRYKFLQVENKSLEYLISKAERHRSEPKEEKTQEREIE